MAVTADLCSWPDLDDLQCHPEVRPPSVAHNRSPAAAGSVHAEYQHAPAETGTTERPVMRGHDRTEPALESRSR
jgi:hypothetical protein